ncbi:hypothetical protein ABW19_dt0208824 [Dactylella cylindrospora]|nr:hypothetical protein ABW19_dt0208824 [Dactylella cylindrospora]
MKLHLLLLSIFLLATSAFALSSPNANTSPAASPSIPFEKRQDIQDNHNCNGSGLCGLINMNLCLRAMEGFADSVTFRSEVRRFRAVSPGNSSHCLALYKCDDPADYALAPTGAQLKDRFRIIYERGCTRCGSNHFYRSCRVTFNLCSGSGCGF